MDPKRRHFNELASRWDQLTLAPDAPPRVAAFVKRAMQPEARRILDLGCGTGVVVPYVLEMAPTLARVVELDFAEQMLRENTDKCDDLRIWRVCSDARALPFPDASFDLVLCFGVLPHLGHPESALREPIRVLRPAGTLSVGHLMGSAELNALHRTVGEPLSSDTLPPAVSLADCLRRLGMGVICAEEDPGWYFVQAVRDQP